MALPINTYNSNFTKVGRIFFFTDSLLHLNSLSRILLLIKVRFILAEVLNIYQQCNQQESS